tara:strand:- start:3345 stop:3638 length:294 start_codon:yes stop_codon:yes gene_type:complete
MVYCLQSDRGGCGLEDTGESAFNPATDVDLVFSTFDIEDTESVPDNLEHTRGNGALIRFTDQSANNRQGFKPLPAQCLIKPASTLPVATTNQTAMRL